MKSYIKENNIGDYSHVSAIVKNLFRLLKIKGYEKSIMELFDLHKHPLSLVAIQDALKIVGVESIGLKLSATDIKALNGLAVVHLQSQHYGSRYVIFYNIDDNENVTYLDPHPEKGWITEPLADFDKRRSGAVLAISNQEGYRKEKDYIKKQTLYWIKQYRAPLIIGLLCSIIIASVFSSPFHWQSIVLLLCKLGGGGISYLLLLQFVDKYNPLVYEICSKGKSDCESVLSSPAANLWGIVSMSEIGAFYFFGGGLTLLFGFLSTSLENILCLLALINIIALPYSIFSVYYQSRIIRQWCILCLGVQAILWLEFAITSSYFTQITSLKATQFAPAILGFGLPLVGWLVIKPLWMDSLKKKLLESKVNYFKKIQEPFKKYWSTLPKEKVSFEEIKATVPPNEIILGDMGGGLTLTMVIDPFCKACADKYKKVRNILLYQPEGVRVIIRLFTGYDEAVSDEEIAEKRALDKYELENEQLRNSVVKRLLAINWTAQPEYVQEAINDWFDIGLKTKKNISKWLERHPLHTEVDEKYLKKWINRICNWHSENELPGAPVTFLNGRRWDEGIYEIEDLVFQGKSIPHQDPENNTLPLVTLN